MGTRERRQREADRRRQDILKAAKKLFWRGGFLGTSIPGIAKAAELAPGTIYLYFPSKEALYVELLLAGYDILHQRLAAEAACRKRPEQQAEALLNVFLTFAREYPEYYDIIFFLVQRERSGGWEGNLPADAVERVRAQENACKQIAFSILMRAGFTDARQCSETLEAVWTMLAGVIFYYRNDPAGERVAARAKEMILSAIFHNRSE